MNLKYESQIKGKIFDGNLKSPEIFRYSENLQKINSNISLFENTNPYTIHLIQEISHNKRYKPFLDSSNNFNSNNDFNNFEQTRNFILKGFNYNFERIIENTKRYFFEECIPFIINSHNENFDKIDFILSESFNIKIVDDVREDSNFEEFHHEMKKVINDTYIHFPLDTDTINQNQHFNKKSLMNSNTYSKGLFTFSSDSNYMERKGMNFGFGQHDYSKWKIKKEFKFYLFFGDENKIKILIDLINDKLKLVNFAKRSKINHYRNSIF